MAASALAYHTIFKDSTQWTNEDINHVMNNGHLYYLTCINKMPRKDTINGFLDPTQLWNELMFDMELIWVFPAAYGCGDGRTTAENLEQTLTAFANLETCTAILTCAASSFGLMKIRETQRDAWKFVFFDSHGRDYRGRRVHKDGKRYSNGRAAILFFNSSQTFVNFFLTQFIDKTTFSLVPIRFTSLSDTENRSAIILDDVQLVPPEPQDTDQRYVNKVWKICKEFFVILRAVFTLAINI